MRFNWLEWLGFLASVTVLISLLMSSVKKLRWINLVGSLFFSVYGFLIRSFPVGFVNGIIVLINIYYLYQFYNSNEYFKILHIEDDSGYLNHFIEYYKSDIDKFNLGYDITNPVISFFVLRDTVPAGVFICSEAECGVLNIELDFVTPRYRDFRIGSYIFEHEKNYFLDKGYNSLVCASKNDSHIEYLKKMGFTEKSDNCNIYIKIL